MAGLTPMMKQYRQIKAEYADCILFFRLGDFYEMFFEDAVLASRELEITLTGRDCGESQRAPMCGIPFHSADSYIAKLVANGHKVAICEQVEDPKNARGIVKRDVVCIITPGTVTDPKQLDGKKNNYLGCIFKRGFEVALVFGDISTGEIFATKATGANRAQVFNELARYQPTELLLNKEAADSYENDIRQNFSAYIGSVDEKIFDYDEAYAEVVEGLDLDDIDDIGLESKPAVVCAVGGVISYLTNTQKTRLSRVLKFTYYEIEQYMEIDMSTRRNLEITETMRDGSKRGSVLWVLDHTKTSMGGRLLKQWLEKPLLSPAQIMERQAGVQELKDNVQLRDELFEVTEKIYDIPRLISRVSIGSVTPRDMVSLKNSIARLPRLKSLLSDTKSDILANQAKRLDTLDDVYDLLQHAIIDDGNTPATVRDGGVIKDGYDQRVDEYRKAMTEGRSWILQMQEQEREATGIKNLKVGYNKVFGYYIEVSKAQTKSVPEHYIRKQTLVNGERYITPKLKEIENLVVNAEERLLRLEIHLFEEVRKKVAEQIERLKTAAEVVAVVDVLCSLAEVAHQNNYICPTIDLSGEIIIKDGRHPVVEKTLKDELFVPNDTLLDKNENRFCIITGPNMAGKSTYMRQVALIVLLAQIGSFVPASYAKIGIVDKLFTRVGASDDLACGKSTFMVEMSEVAYILKNATPDSLIIFDEIGRGTSTYDGLSIAWAVVEYVSDTKKIGAKTLFATHYHELTELENRLDGVKNYCIAVKKRGDDITFLRKIICGGADGSYGVEVAALAGVPSDVIGRAKKILETLEENDPNKPRQVKINLRDTRTQTDEMQIGFETFGSREIIDTLKKIDITTYTPLEALNKLNELINKAKAL